MHRIIILVHFVAASAHRVQIARDAGRLLKLIESNIVLTRVEFQKVRNVMSIQYSLGIVRPSVVVSFLERIAHRFPVGRATDSQGHFCLERGLIENREYVVAVESFKLGVQVLLLVGLVNIGVQTNTVCVVGVQVLKLNSVPALDNVGLSESKALIGVNPCCFLIVDCQVRDRYCLEVEPKLVVTGLSLDIEVDDGFAHVKVAFAEAKLEIVFNFAQKFATTLSFRFLEGYVLVVAGVENGLIAQMLKDLLLALVGGYISIRFVVYHK